MSVKCVFIQIIQDKLWTMMQHLKQWNNNKKEPLRFLNRRRFISRIWKEFFVYIDHLYIMKKFHCNIWYIRLWYIWVTSKFRFYYWLKRDSALKIVTNWLPHFNLCMTCHLCSYALCAFYNWIEFTRFFLFRLKLTWFLSTKNSMMECDWK